MEEPKLEALLFDLWKYLHLLIKENEEYCNDLLKRANLYKDFLLMQENSKKWVALVEKTLSTYEQGIFTSKMAQTVTAKKILEDFKNDFPEVCAIYEALI